MGRPRKEPLTEMQKLAKKIGDDAEEVLKELEAADVETLNKRIAQANHAIVDTKAELEADLPNGGPNPYMVAKEDVKTLSEGFRGVKKRQNAIIAVCLQLRNDRGAT